VILGHNKVLLPIHLVWFFYMANTSHGFLLIPVADKCCWGSYSWVVNRSRNTHSVQQHHTITILLLRQNYSVWCQRQF